MVVANENADRDVAAPIPQCAAVGENTCANGTYQQGMPYCSTAGCLSSPTIYRCRGGDDTFVTRPLGYLPDTVQCRTAAGRMMCEASFPVCDPSHPEALAPRVLCFRSCTNVLTGACAMSAADAEQFCLYMVVGALSDNITAVPPACFEIDSFGDDYCAENAGIDPSSVANGSVSGSGAGHSVRTLLAIVVIAASGALL